ncbi:MAG: S8 family serine peptidase, partial [Nanoarchaeota archaeon]
LLKPVYSDEHVVGDIEEINTALEENQYVNIIIWLKDNEFTSPEYQEDLDIKRNEIDKIQDKVLSRLSEEDFILKYRYEATNGFAGIISKSGFEKLLNDNNVKEIYLDREIKAFLAESRQLINADNIESFGINSSGVTVCVIDSGINYTHPALGSCTTSQFMAGNCNKVISGVDYCNGPFCSGPTDFNPMDESGHGTYVAGIIASEDNQFRGVAPATKLVAVKVLNGTGSGTFSALAAGIDWCRINSNLFSIKIITMSLGDGSSYNSTNPCPFFVGSTILNAYNAGIFIDAASGNQGYISGISYPA